MTVQRDISYFSFLGEGLRQLIAGLLHEEGVSLFRKNPSVILGQPNIQEPNDFYLCFVNQTFQDKDTGSIRFPSADNERLLVFRRPVIVTVRFALISKTMNWQSSAKAYDRLNGFFFDNRSIEPILSPQFKQFPSLQQLMLSKKAEITQVDEKRVEVSGFRFCFDYTALYHSGRILREETYTKERVIHFEKDEQQERKVL